MIDLDRITNDPTHEYYAYKPKKPQVTMTDVVRIPLWLVVICVAVVVLVLVGR